MSKKSFNNVANPALKFITAANDEINTDNTHNNLNAHNTHIKNNSEIKNLDKKIPTKNTTKNNAHISETKSRRFNLLAKPSIIEDITKIATMKETSPNDLINIAIEEYNKRNSTLIDKYNSVFN